MTLWDWAGQTWERVGVGEACLALQETHGQCVPLLLWAIWSAEEGGGGFEVDRAVVLCRSMEEAVIAPLRAARRRAVIADRDALLANELKAEHELLDQLELLSLGARGVAAGKRDRTEIGARLSQVARLWGRPLAPDAFRPLIEALSVREVADV